MAINSIHTEDFAIQSRLDVKAHLIGQEAVGPPLRDEVEEDLVLVSLREERKAAGEGDSGDSDEYCPVARGDGSDG